MLRTALILAIVLAAVPAGAATGSAAPARATPASTTPASAAPLNPFDRPRGIRPRLDYTRAPGAQACPDELHFRSEVAAHLGHEAFSEQGTWLFHVYAFRRPNGTYGVVGNLFDDKAEKRADIDPLNGRDCKTLLITYLALHIAVYLTDPPALPPEPAAPPAPPPPPPPPPPPRANPFTLRLGFGSVVGFGVAPRVAVGASGDIGIYWPVTVSRLDGISLSLGGLWHPSVEGSAAGSDAGTPESFSRLLVTLAPCAHWWKLFLCAVGEVGQIQGFDSAALPTTITRVYAAMGGRAGVEVPFAPHLGFRVSGEVLGTASPVNFSVNDRPGWMTPSVSGDVGAGLYLYY